MPTSYTRIFVHLVWGTWDRMPLLVGPFRETVYRSVRAECTRVGAELIAIGGVEDHVHLLVRVPASLAVATLVKQLKGVSSHMANGTAGCAFRWQGGYGALSVSERAIPRVRDYILRQEEHHRLGTFHPAAELS